MKKRVLLSVIVLTVFSVNSFAADKSKDAAAKEEVKSKNSVLFVGVQPQNLLSNCFSPAQMAENFSVAQTEVESCLNREIYTAFREAAVKANLDIATPDAQTAEGLSDRLEYEYKGDEMNCNLANLDNEEYRTVLHKFGAGYLLVVDQYYVKQEGYPYNNYSHILNYSVYDASRNKVFSDRYQFATLDMGSREQIFKQVKKAAGKFIRTIE